jgi:uncharacterized protein (TIGR02147 family)
MNTTIYEYRDPRRYLMDRFNEIKKKNSRYSLRGFAKLLGLSSHSGLVQFINGDRSLSKKCIDPITKALKLNTVEKEYFELLVELSKTQAEESDKLEDRLKVLSLKATTKTTSDGIEEILEEPLNFYLLEMADIAPIVNELKKLRLRLKLNYSEEEIRVALDNLLSAGFLKMNVEGNYIRDKRRFIRGESDKPLKVGKEYHKRVLAHAAEAILKNKIEEREFNGVVLNVDGNKLSQMKKDIRDFINEFIVKYDEPSADNVKTYQLNQQLFLVADNE